MIKRILTVFTLLTAIQFVSAKEIPVNVIPLSKITTSNVNLQEGDSATFIVKDDVYVNSKLYIKKDEPVTGVITSIEDNGYLYKPATIYIDNFSTQNVNNKTIKLKGIVYKTGNDHANVTQFIPVPFVWLRGGEVQIKPEKDVFTLILED